MADLIFKPFGQQKKLLLSPARKKGAFAGKRGGKTEFGAIQTIKLLEEKPNGHLFGRDPYLAVVMAPTYDMLRRLSLKKFMQYAKPFISDYNKSNQEITWHDGAQVYGLSADRPERIEGIKAGVMWLDEVFQMSEALFLECLARLSDTKGYLIATGSLGPQFVNPKRHWVYKYFKQEPDEETMCIEWSTADNPYFPQDELESMKQRLDAQTYRAMFELTWDTVPTNGVYSEFNDINITRCDYNPKLPLTVSIDWGWAHPMACGFFQYDAATDTVYQIDEIIQSRLKLEELLNKIQSKPYKITDWCCDIAGNQEREQTAISNVEWFRQKGIKLDYRRTAIQYGIPIVRSYIRNAKGQAKYFIDPKCKQTIDGIQQYAYAEKDGEILNENPIKKNDDAVDMVRYYFVNRRDPELKTRVAPSMIKR